MKQFNEDVFNSDWAEFWKNMTECGLAEHFVEEKLKNNMKTAPALLNEDSGVAYPGGLLRHIVLFTAISKKISKMIGGAVEVNNNSLLKVCCLQHLSKLVMFTKNTNDWEVTNRGLNYKFSELKGRLKSGERSILIANDKNIKLTPEEFEAIRSCDKDNEDQSAKNFDCILSVIVRCANELTYNIEKIQYKRQKQ